MKYKDDWDQVKKRHTAFWEREIIDRCCVSVTAYKKGSNYKPEPFPEKPDDKFNYWTDGEQILRRHRRMFENTYFAGDSFPHIPLYLGAVGHAGYFKNARYRLEDTVWFFPSIHNWEKDQLEFDPDSPLYTKTLELARYFADEGKGEFIISMPDIGGYIDALSHLRGPENVLIDMVEEKEMLHDACDKIREVWHTTNEQVYQIVKGNNEGGCSVGWLDTWAPGRHTQAQCDLSCMISPQAFSEFIVPEIESQASWSDYLLYHLDGFEQIRHLEMLLSIKKLSAIQWTCVEGQPSPLEFIPVLRRIQDAGKGLVIAIKPEELEPLMQQLSSKGLYLILRADSAEEADKMVECVKRLTHE